MKPSSSLGLLLFVVVHAAAPDVVVSAESPICTAGGESTTLIIGAGMAGLTAAKRFHDLGISYKLIESTTRVGGRIRSKEFGGYTIEDGANWVTGGSRASKLTAEYGLKRTLTRWQNFAIYEYNPNNDSEPGGNATEISSDYLRGRKKFWKAYRCVIRQAKAAYLPGGPDLSLDVQTVVLPSCGWKPNSVRESLAYFFPWFEIDSEYGTPSIPLSNVDDDEYSDNQYFVNDERGFDFIPRNFRKIHSIPVEFGKRVTSIEYNIPDNDYPALVTTIDTSGTCIEYKAKYVLSTVSIGVYESDAIEFNPPLLYPKSPYAQQQYAKIFYQFKTKFWDDKEFIVALKRTGNEGICHHWQNLDYVKRPRQRTGRMATAREFYPDSKILFCTITSEAMYTLLGKDNVQTTNLSQEQLRGELLDPLRAVYGNELVDANLEAVYDPQLNTNPDTGFGAYADFLGDKGPSGDVLKNLYNFFGGYDIPGVDIDRCDHNGCAVINGQEKWVLHMSGAASCFENYELVSGAIESGDRSANYIAKELGYNVSTESAGCEVFYAVGDEDGGENRYLRRSEPHWVHHA